MSVLSITLVLGLITPICSTNMLWTWVRRQDLNEDAPHPLGVCLFLLLLLLIIIFIIFFCISSHWCTKNAKTNPIAHNFIVPHLPSSSGAHCARERDVPCPERDTTPAAAPGQTSLLSLRCPLSPRTAGSDASTAHSHGTERGHQGQKMTKRKKSAKRRQEGIE